MERTYTHYTRNNARIHANHTREYSSHSWNSFSGLRTLQRSLIQTTNLCKTVHGAISIPKVHILRSRHRRKNQSTAYVPGCINQSAANQSNDPLAPPGILTRGRQLAYTDGPVLVKKLVRGRHISISKNHYQISPNLVIFQIYLFSMSPRVY